MALIVGWLPTIQPELGPVEADLASAGSVDLQLEVLGLAVLDEGDLGAELGERWRPPCPYPVTAAGDVGDGEGARSAR